MLPISFDIAEAAKEVVEWNKTQLALGRPADVSAILDAADALVMELRKRTEEHDALESENERLNDRITELEDEVSDARP